MSSMINKMKTVSTSHKNVSRKRKRDTAQIISFTNNERIFEEQRGIGKDLKAESSRNIEHETSNGPSDTFNPHDSSLNSSSHVNQYQSSHLKVDRRNSIGGDDQYANAQEPDPARQKHSSIFKKFQKAADRSFMKKRGLTDESNIDTATAEQPQLQDIVPLPMPAVSNPDEVPSFPTLPSWLSSPDMVSRQEDIPFSLLGLDQFLLDNLSQKNLHRSLAVQSAALRLLNPGETQHYGDLCLAAATGSGKTLAYVLPVVQSISKHANTGLRAVIVVPTRELVNQVREVVDMCVAGSSIQVATATGSKTFENEREQLIRRQMKYDPKEYSRRQQQFSQPAIHTISNYDDLEEDRSFGAVEDFLDSWPFHIPEYVSRADILISTPGRLVEHLRSRNSINLEALEWLVLDEADRLLQQDFQEFVDTINASIAGQKFEAVCGHDNIDRELILRRKQDLRHKVRKIVLSATMTQDIEKLGSLRLWNPKLLLVNENEASIGGIQDSQTPSGLQFNLPSTLAEFVVPVNDGSDKPLYLLQLLWDISQAKSKAEASSIHDRTKSTQRISTSPEETKEYSSDSDLTDSSDSESETSESDSSSDDSMTSSSTLSSSTNDENETKSNAVNPSFLVFTASTQSAIRLHHLLGSLESSWAPRMSVLTKATSASHNSKIAQTMKSTKGTRNLTPTIIICTDRASRGLDLPHLDYVINYDLSHDLTSYIHRIGRTARAGHAGQAWTLVADREARWFWNNIGRSKDVLRGVRKVQRKKVSIEGLGSGIQDRYAKALQRLKEDTTSR